jgi:hypothetical protein
MLRILRPRAVSIAAALLLAAAVLPFVPGQVAALTTSGYRLPWVAGDRWQVTTTWNEESHVGVNAYDFILYRTLGSDGAWHTGKTLGQPVVAAAAGTVRTVTNVNTGVANVVVIKLGDGTLNYYNHLMYLSQPPVKVGQKVAQGQIIGRAGNTGGSTGPHLHFQLNVDKPSTKYYFVEAGQQLSHGSKWTSQNYAPVSIHTTRHAISKTRIALDWTNLTTDSPKFLIQRQVSSGPTWTTVTTVGSTTRHFDDVVSASVETYYYRICNQTSAGTNCSLPSEVHTDLGLF